MLKLNVPASLAQSNITCMAEMQRLVHGMPLRLARLTEDIGVIDLRLVFPVSTALARVQFQASSSYKIRLGVVLLISGTASRLVELMVD
jgi:hypothetical protein